MDARIIAATGHRPHKLGGYTVFVRDRLFALAFEYLGNESPDAVVSGFAQGWDLAIAKASLFHKIPLIAAVPCYGQETKWPEPAQHEYRCLLAQASEIHYLSPFYTAECMQTRNVWMVNRSTDIVALWDGSSGGTANCVNYAFRTHRRVTNLWEKWVSQAR